MKNHAEALQSLGINPRLLLTLGKGGRMALAPGISIAVERDKPSVLKVEVADQHTPGAALVFEQTDQGIKSHIEVSNAGRSGVAKMQPNETLRTTVQSYISRQLSRSPEAAAEAFTGGDFTRHMVEALTGERVHLNDSRSGFSLSQRAGQLHWGAVLQRGALSHSTPVVAPPRARTLPALGARL